MGANQQNEIMYEKFKWFFLALLSSAAFKHYLSELRGWDKILIIIKLKWFLVKKKNNLHIFVKINK